MTYISGERADQWNAEDRQRSHVLSYAEARMLNEVDQAIAAIKRAQMETSDTDADGFLKDALDALEGLKANVEGGW